MFHFLLQGKDQKMNNEKGLLQVSLEVQSLGELTRFSCSIANVGIGDIAIGNTFLFIDQGIFNKDNLSYMFPFIQKKFLGIEGIADEDCVACAQCKRNDATYPLSYPHIHEFYKGTTAFCNCYSLPHLSSQSILYMAPNERFTEEIMLNLNQGVYRAILVSVPCPDSCDCICCNRCFSV